MARTLTVGPLLSIVDGFLDAKGWPHERLAGRDVITFAFQGDDERWSCYAEAREDQERVVFYSVCPYNVPEEGRPAAMEFVTRVNYGLLVGNFELDLADGEVRFKTSLDVRGAELTPILVARAIMPNLLGMNTYLPGIAAIVGGDRSSPAQLVAAIEA
jgi:hypothetical protein